MIEQDELLADFIDEALQHFQTIEPDLLELEKEGDKVDEEIVNRLFRGMHSIKGAAGFFGLKNINNLGHTMESLLSLVREKRIKVESELVDSLLAGVDILRSLVEDVANSDNQDISTISQQLDSLLQGTPVSTKKVKLFEISEGGNHGRSFDLTEEEVKRFVKYGKEVYSVEVYLNKDISDKKKTPFDFINNMTSVGEFINVSFSFDKISGLEDCLNNELSVVFLFTTILEKDFVPLALEIPEQQIKQINLETYKQHFKENLTGKSEKQVEPAEDSTGSEKEPTKEQGDKPSAKPLKSQPDGARQIESDEKIRVGVSVMNDLMNLAGELVLGRNQLMQTALPLIKDVQGLNPVLQHVSRITTEMQGKIMQMRMQPVSVLFSKFHRVVRELAKKLGKEIRLVTYGEDVELDKTIIEALSDPMTHLIRNCCDHAIEKPEEREKSGKPRLGTIELKAYHQAGQVHLEIIDDGKGIDGKKIAQKALEKKLITESQLDEMGIKEMTRLILKAGFSTAESISDVSGRGVGMDVVQTNISQLGGKLDIETELGAGTKIVLMLPLTLAIVSGLVIRSSDQHFIIPEANIDELVRIKPEEINQRINTIHDAQVLRLRDKLLPLVHLKTVLKLGSESGDVTQNINGEPVRVLVAKYGTARIGLIVDSLENFEEIVVKPLPRYMKSLKSYSGTSIMGNGNVSLILDIAGIVSKANLAEFAEGSAITREKQQESVDKEEQQTLLLFDNMTEERFALPLELITRIERVSAANIERIKDKSYMQYQDEELRLVFLEDYLPINAPERRQDDTLGVVIPKQMKHQLGLVIGRVHGTLTESVQLDTRNVVAPGLFGSAILDGKITLLPDLYKLFELAVPEWHLGDREKTLSKKKKSILLVDDTAFFRMIEEEYLTSAGYNVLVAENGRKALELLEKQKVDAMVLDIVMPVMNGWEVIQELRSDNRFRELPVMAVTSLRDEQDRERGLESGFTAWESKLNKETLLSTLEKILS